MIGQNIQVKKGVVLRPSHGVPHIWQMIECAIRCAPMMEEDEIVITEAWRTPRHPDDAHTWCNAFDIRIHNIIGAGNFEEAIAEGWEWVIRMRADHNDPRYQFDVHGVGANAHIHMEFDPR